MAARSLLARVQRLEARRAPPWERLIGSPDEFETEVLEGIAAGRIDPIEGPEIVACVRGWIRRWQ